MGIKLNLKGKVFGRLVVKEEAERMNKSSSWKVECECGVEKQVRTEDLTSGKTKSCGCLCRDLASERQLRHGENGTPLHRRWMSMRRRCSPKSEDAKHYYLRGIKVCKEWDDFSLFKRDMGESFKEELELDRIDNNKGYCKENCRWVTHRENILNRGMTLFIDDNGTKMLAVDYAKKYNLNYRSVKSRLYRSRLAKLRT